MSESCASTSFARAARRSARAAACSRPRSRGAAPRARAGSRRGGRRGRRTRARSGQQPEAEREASRRGERRGHEVDREVRSEPRRNERRREQRTQELPRDDGDRHRRRERARRAARGPLEARSPETAGGLSGTRFLHAREFAHSSNRLVPGDVLTEFPAGQSTVLGSEIGNREARLQALPSPMATEARRIPGHARDLRARGDVRNERIKRREPRPLLRLGQAGASTASATRSTRLDARRADDPLEHRQGALEVLRDLQAAGARRARQEDRRLHLHDAHQDPRRRPALDAQQWLALDDAADLFADGTIRITSRQGDPVPPRLRAEARAADPAPEPRLPRLGHARAPAAT